MTPRPLILYVPGLLPKPEPAVHERALWRCLLRGLERADAATAAAIERTERSFDIVSWTYDFYGEHRDFAIDAASVERLLERDGPDERDLAEAASPKRRLARWLFSLADLLPFLIPHVANERMELHLADLRRYLGNRNGIADHARQMLKLPLRAAAEGRRPVLLIAHSMGSVIAWEALWEMTHEDGDAFGVDLLLTMGSPLGQRYIQDRIRGCHESGAYRYPHNLRRWINLSAVGDLTAIDPTLADDFGEMIRLGLVEDIEDYGIENYFRSNGELNAHSEYGYLVNPVTARIVTEWWQERARA